LGALSPDLTLEINYEGSVRLAEAARAAGVRRFLFASSCSLYGKTAGGWVDESSPLAPLTAYAESKARSEDKIMPLANDQFTPIMLRCATVYGASRNLRLDLVVNNLVAWALTHGEVRILSDGTPWRPLVHVADLCEAYCYFLEADSEPLAINVGFDEQNYQVRDIAETVGKMVPQAQITYGDGDKDSRSYRVSFKHFRELTGLKPQWNVESGAAQLVETCTKFGLTAAEFEGPRFVRLRELRRLLDKGQLNSRLKWVNKGSFLMASPSE
jgi:nucleoside-diphosphate-sugar epimerase